VERGITLYLRKRGDSSLAGLARTGAVKLPGTELMFYVYRWITIVKYLPPVLSSSDFSVLAEHPRPLSVGSHSTSRAREGSSSPGTTRLLPGRQPRITTGHCPSQKIPGNEVS
jgi:hypothetical protein